MFVGSVAIKNDLAILRETRFHRFEVLQRNCLIQMILAELRVIVVSADQQKVASRLHLVLNFLHFHSWGHFEILFNEHSSGARIKLPDESRNFRSSESVLKMNLCRKIAVVPTYDS